MPNANPAPPSTKPANPAPAPVPTPPAAPQPALYRVLHSAVAGKIRDYVRGEIIAAEQVIGSIEFYVANSAVAPHNAE